MGQRELDGLLRDWGDSILREIEASNYGKETITYKLMKCGVMVKSGFIPIPNYWPKSQLVKINDAVWSLPVGDRNIIVLKRILGYSYSEIGKEFNCSKTGAFDKTKQAEQNILKYLNT